MAVLLKKLLLFLPFLLAIAVFNWKVAPASLFVPQYEEDIVSLLLQGKDVAGPSSYNGRRLQVLFAEAQDKPRDILVLGSSRAMGISSKLLNSPSLYNAWVNCGVLRDHLAIYGTFRRRGLLPKTLILGVDPWLFNAESLYNKKKLDAALEPDYHLMMKNMGLPIKGTEARDLFSSLDPRIEKYLELLSPAYLQQSVKFLIAKKKARSQSKSSPENPDGTKRCHAALPGEEPFKYSDGSYLYPKSKNNRPPETVLLDVAKATQFNVFENYTQFDPELVEEFEHLVARAQQDKVEVVFYLPPLHPVLYEKVANTPEYRKVIEAELYFRNYAEKLGIRVRGSYNPQTCGLESSDFVDGWHLRNEAFGKAFQIESIEGIIHSCKDIQALYELRRFYKENAEALKLIDNESKERLANFEQRPAGLDGVDLVGFEWILQKPQTEDQDALFLVNCLIHLKKKPVFPPGAKLFWGVYGAVDEKDRVLFRNERFRKNGRFDFAIQDLPIETWEEGGYYVISRSISVPDIPYKLSYSFSIKDVNSKFLPQPVVVLGDSAQYVPPAP
jgi:hypothetical protein